MSKMAAPLNWWVFLEFQPTFGDKRGLFSFWMVLKVLRLKVKVFCEMFSQKSKKLKVVEQKKKCFGETSEFSKLRLAL